MHPSPSRSALSSRAPINRLGGFLALTLIISTQVSALSWGNSTVKPLDPMPAVAHPVSTKTVAAENLTATSDPLSLALAQLLVANHITPIVQVRTGRHSKIESVSDRMHYVLTLDSDVLKQPSSLTNEAALIALQLAVIDPTSTILNSLSPSRRNLIEYRAALLLSNAKLPLTSLEAVLTDVVKQPRLYSGIGSESYSLSTFDTSRLVSFQRWADDSRLQQARLTSRATGNVHGIHIAPLIPTHHSVSGLQGAVQASMTSPRQPAASVGTTPTAPEKTATNFLAFTDPPALQPSPIIQLMMSLTPAQLQLLSALRDQASVKPTQLSLAVAGMNRRQLELELTQLMQKQLIERASGGYKLSQWASDALWFPGKATP